MVEGKYHDVLNYELLAYACQLSISLLTMLNEVISITFNWFSTLIQIHLRQYNLSMGILFLAVEQRSAV